MQVTLESDEIAEIVDVSIENALAPIRVENRRLLALVNELQSIVADQKKQANGYVPLKDFTGIRDQAFGAIESLRNELDVVKEIRAIPGDPGSDGKDGAPGADGKDGQSFTVDDARPFIVEEVERIVSSIPAPQNGKDGAPGKDGRDGKDGIGLAGAMVDRNGELFITTSTGETKGLGTVAGRDGLDGKDGAPGLDGKDGAAGLDGKDGAPGLDGKDGVPGSDGISIKGDSGLPGKDGESIKGDQGDPGADGVSVIEAVVHDGQLMLRLSNGRMLDAGLVRGPAGEPGESIKGDPGESGKDGVSIDQGVIEDGHLVLELTDGRSLNVGLVQGPSGKDGVSIQGERGRDGESIKGDPGEPGLDGISIAECVVDGGNLALKFTDGRVVNAGLVCGPKGDPGESIKGEPGKDGKDGASIAAAEIDAAGSLILKTTDGRVLNAGRAKGSRGDPGKDGEAGGDGAPGKDVELDYVDRAIAASCAEAFGELSTSVAANQSKALGQLEDGTAALIRRMDGMEVRIDEHLALIPSRVEVAAKSIPRPADGHTPTMAELSELIERALQPALAARPVPKDGVGLAGMLIDRNGNLVATLSSGETRELGTVVGKDGASVDKNAVEALVSSTLATWPRPADGRDGLGFDDFDVLYDGERKISFRMARGSEIKEWNFEVPVLIDRGVWRDGVAYSRGDTATYGGSLWVAQRQTTAKPGDPGVDTGWRLAVKAGRPGKDGVPGARGEPGKPGSPGRDLTRLMPDGSKY